MTRGVVRGRWRGACVTLLAVASVAACSRPAPPRTADDAVRLEIHRAEAAEAKREHDVARRHYEAAIASARDPRSLGFARREFGETLATWGETAEAATQLEGSVTATPSDPIAWQRLGIVRHALGDIRGALTALERAKLLAPRAWIPRRDLAVVHWSRGEGRHADPDPQVAARHRAAALAEYKAMLELDLPPRLREKVRWAIEILSRPSGAAPAPPS